MTVYVIVKGLKYHVEKVFKETMSPGASKATNKKVNKLAKKRMRQQ